MSKVGKLPVAIPAGVTVTVADNVVSIKGPKGEMKQNFSNNIKIEVQGSEVILTTLNDTKQANADHGLYRSLVANMVKVPNVSKKEADKVAEAFGGEAFPEDNPFGN